MFVPVTTGDFYNCFDEGIILGQKIKILIFLKKKNNEVGMIRFIKYKYSLEIRQDTDRLLAGGFLDVVRSKASLCSEVLNTPGNSREFSSSFLSCSNKVSQLTLGLNTDLQRASTVDLVLK